MSGASLRLDGVWLALGERLLVAPLTLSVAPGTVTTLMGPSGCGKSSLLASLCGMLDPAFRCGGRAWLDDRELAPLPPERRRLIEVGNRDFDRRLLGNSALEIEHQQGIVRNRYWPFPAHRGGEPHSCKTHQHDHQAGDQNSDNQSEKEVFHFRKAANERA